MADRNTICILSLSAIADDPRARRQGDAFHAAGWKVVGVGLPGAKSPPPVWQVLTARPQTIEHRPPHLRALTAARYLKCRVDPEAALDLYWSRPWVPQVLESATGVHAAVWLANDWNTLPIAARLADREGGIIGYDTHELATSEYEESLIWRLFYKPMAAAIERRFIPRARIITAVSGDIGRRLGGLYPDAPAALEVRSTPVYQAARFRPTGSPVRALYHGLLSKQRGLEETIDSVKLWRPGITLTLRGPSTPSGYSADLQKRIDAAGLSDRITIEPPVPMTDLVAAARDADVGLFALRGHSRHNQMALPNKFFEYVMAGLALCVSDLPEMAKLVRRYDLGVLIPDNSPAAIARAMNALDPGSIDRHKRASLEAAKTLCWERESEAMLTAYARQLRDKPIQQIQA